MSRFVFRLVVAVAAGVLLAGSSIAAAASVSHTVRVGRAPRRPAGSSVVGALPAATTVRVSVVLKPRDPAALQSYANAVSTPGSSLYHQYLSVAGFRQRFGPTDAQVAAVQVSLRAHGLNPSAVSANGLAIAVTSTAGSLSSAFSTSLQRMAVPGGRTAFANTTAPLLDSSVAGFVQGVVGLDNLSIPQPLALRAPHGRAHVSGHVVTGGPQPCSDAQSAGSSIGVYTTDQIASAYRFSSLYGAGDEGAGQTIAIYELEGNFPSDVSAFESCYGITTPVSYQQVDGGPPAPVAGSDGLETELDIENTIGLASNAHVIVYQGPNSNSGLPGSGPYDTYNAIISADAAKVISTSWGECEPIEGTAAAAAENTLFQEAAVQGQTILAASGDSGSEDCGDGFLHVDDPASQPYVTGVGGSSLTSLGPPPAESVWNDTCNSGPCGGGGGISSLWAMPSYQSSAPLALNVINANSSGSPCGASPGSHCREVPDVSADADPNTGYLIYYDGGWGGIGGTSAGAPLWAALIALTNASSACSGGTIGFANPALYRGAAIAYSNDFNDVTSGNNDITGFNGGLFPAGTGYDMASGLGTPNAANLPAALCALTVRVSNPNTQTSVVGVPVSLAIRAGDASGKTLSYGASGLPAGLSINSATGVISGTPTVATTENVTVYAGDSDGGVGNATFGWNVDPITASVSNPGHRKNSISTMVRLQIRAGDNNGGALRFGAYGLPRGLSINTATGFISGLPANGGNYSVTVTARDGGASGSTQFKWTIKGPGTSGSSLTGIARGKPTLVSTLSAVGGSHALKAVVFGLPPGLSFSSDLSSGITLTGSNGKRVRGARLRVVNGRLKITLPKGMNQLRVAIAQPVLRPSQGLISRVKRRQAGTLVVTLKVTDSSGHVTPLTLALKPS